MSLKAKIEIALALDSNNTSRRTLLSNAGVTVKMQWHGVIAAGIAMLVAVAVEVGYLMWKYQTATSTANTP
jgi:hypothetical protein